MKKFDILRLLQVIVLAMVFAPPAPGQGMEIRYREQIKKLEDFFSRFQSEGKLDEEITPPPDKDGKAHPVLRTIQVRYATDSGRVMYYAYTTSDSRSLPTKFHENIFVYDPSYKGRPLLFTLRREEPEGSFLLNLIEHSKKSGIYKKIKDANAYFKSPISLDNYYLPELLESADFSFWPVEGQKGGKGGRLRFGFRLRTTDRVAGMKGWFELSPDEAWVIRDYEFETDDRLRKMHGHVEYQGSAEGIPTPYEVTIEGSFINKSATRRVCRFTSFRHVTTPAREFTLEAFGLGDLAIPGESRDLTWFWLFGVAIIAAVLSILLRKYARGSRLTPAHPA